ncbi:MAG: hypothetical protein AAF934_00370, partial [Bacteroidota bacterium]
MITIGDWEKTFDINLSKIDESYLDSRLSQTNNSYAIPFLDSETTKTKIEFLSENKKRFLKNIRWGYISEAFRKLQKQIPI